MHDLSILKERDHGRKGRFLTGEYDRYSSRRAIFLSRVPAFRSDVGGRTLDVQSSWVSKGSLENAVNKGGTPFCCFGVWRTFENLPKIKT